MGNTIKDIYNPNLSVDENVDNLIKWCKAYPSYSSWGVMLKNGYPENILRADLKLRLSGEVSIMKDLFKSVSINVPKKEYLVVFEDEWNNKEHIRTERIGEAILHLSEVNDFSIEGVDIDKYNSEHPYDAGTMGPGFYDIEVQKLDDPDSYGRIMIFDL